MPSVMVVLIGSVIGCLIGGVLGYLGYKVGRAVESRMWLLAEVIWLRKAPPGEALVEREAALAHVGRLRNRVPPEMLGKWREVGDDNLPHETPGPTLVELYERKREAA